MGRRRRKFQRSQALRTNPQVRSLHATSIDAASGALAGGPEIALRFSGRLGCLFLLGSLQAGVAADGELRLEFLNPPCRVDVLQFPRKKRVTSLADVDSKFLFGAASLKRVAATAGYDRFNIGRMNTVLHDRTFLLIFRLVLRLGKPPGHRNPAISGDKRISIPLLRRPHKAANIGETHYSHPVPLGNIGTMSTLRYWTAGESHGRALLALVDGFPAGLRVDSAMIDYELKRRQGGYGRGGRQRIETDQVQILSGIWRGTTLGSPIALEVVNKDFKLDRLDDLESPRPGHGDLAGALKYNGSMRAILERASARETAARVAAGALAKQLLSVFQIETLGYVVEIGGVPVPPLLKPPLSGPPLSGPPLSGPPIAGTPKAGAASEIGELRALRDSSSIYSLNPEFDAVAERLIDEVQKAGDTLGGVVEVRVVGMPFGLGTHAQWDQKLDGRIAQAVMAVQAIKGVEIGLGFESARRRGSQVHDPIQFDPSRIHESHAGYVRPTNNAGGLEAGMTNGQPLIVRAAKKPISTLAQPLESIDMTTKKATAAAYERSDVCAISAASVIVESVVAFEVARALVEKFGGDSLIEMQSRWRTFHELLRQR